MIEEKIKKEDWKFIRENNEPDYEQKFKALMMKYMNNASNTINDISQWRKYEYLKSISNSDTWIADITLTEKDPKKVDYARYLTFYNLLDNIGMMEDYFKFFGKSKDEEKIFALFYLKMLSAQTERKKQNERNGIFSNLINKLTGAVAPGKFVSKIKKIMLKEQEKGDNENGNER